MSIKRTPDPLGMRGDRATIEPDGKPETFAAVAALIAENTPAARIERLRQHPALQELADRLAAELVNGSASKELLIEIAGAEQHAIAHRVAPLVDKGRKFTPKGRGPGPIRKAIERLLKRKPDMTNAELWVAIAAKPPRGWSACDNRLGRYLEAPSVGNVSLARFKNIASEVRKALKST